MTLTTGVQCLTHNLDLAIPRLTRRQLNMAYLIATRDAIVAAMSPE